MGFISRLARSVATAFRELPKTEVPPLRVVDQNLRTDVMMRVGDQTFRTDGVVELRVGNVILGSDGSVGVDVTPSAWTPQVSNPFDT